MKQLVSIYLYISLITLHRSLHFRITRRLLTYIHLCNVLRKDCWYIKSLMVRINWFVYDFVRIVLFLIQNWNKRYTTVSRPNGVIVVLSHVTLNRVSLVHMSVTVIFLMIYHMAIQIIKIFITVIIEKLIIFHINT